MLSGLDALGLGLKGDEGSLRALSLSLDLGENRRNVAGKPHPRSGHQHGVANHACNDDSDDDKGDEPEGQDNHCRERHTPMLAAHSDVLQESLQGPRVLKFEVQLDEVIEAERHSLPIVLSRLSGDLLGRRGNRHPS